VRFSSFEPILIWKLISAAYFLFILVVNQTILIRENFGDTALGTCRETIEGGEHYRVWRQNGTAVRLVVLLYLSLRFCTDREVCWFVGKHWSLVLGCFFRDEFRKQPHDYRQRVSFSFHPPSPSSNRTNPNTLIDTTSDEMM